MRERTLLPVCTALLFGLALVLAVGGAVADTGVDAGEEQSAEFDLLDVQDPEGVTITSAVEAEAGETQLLVTLSSPERVEGPDQLQAHARESQSDLLRFVNRTAGVTVENRFWLANAVLLTADLDRVAPETVARIDGVEAIERNAEVHALDGVRAGNESATAKQSGPSAGPAVESSAETRETFNTTYGLDQVNATEAWTTYDTRGEGTAVAVLDSGIDASHPDLNLTKWAEFTTFGGQKDSEPSDPHPRGHGTHTSGTVAGGNESGEYIGVAPRTALYHGGVLRSCDSSGCTGTRSQIIAGMEWGVENDVEVISMSLGAEGYATSYIEAVRNAEAAGTVVVASIGNDNEGTSGSPGNVYDTISVGAATESEDITSFSSGERIETSRAWGSDAPSDWPSEYTVPVVSAPGARVKSTLPNGTYGDKWGTSMAAPHVSGTIALMQSATDYHVSPAQIELALERTARKPPGAPAPAGERDTRYGSGLINAPPALELVTNGTAAGFSVDPAAVTPGDTVTLSANASLGATTYEWDLTGNGTVDATGEVVSFTYQNETDYEVTLTVSDGNGSSDSTTKTLAVREPVVEQRWAFDAGDSVLSSPTVVTDESGTRTVFVGDTGGNVSALNATTGKPFWRFETGDAVRSSPTVVNVSGTAGRTVFVGSSDGTVYALDAATGEHRWTFETGGPVKSSPTVIDDAVGGRENPADGGTVFVGSSDGNVSALNAATGERVWRFETGDAVQSSPTVASVPAGNNSTDRIVFVGSDDGNVSALDAATGERVWRFETDGTVVSSPTVANVTETDDFGSTAGWTVFVGSGGFTLTGADDTALYAINATTGTEAWRFETGGAVRSSPTVGTANETQTVFVGSDDNSVYAVEAATGDERWAFETGNSVDSSPTVTNASAAGGNATVVVGSWDENVYAVDAVTGDERWREGQGAQVFRSSPTVVNGTVFVGSENDTLAALTTSALGTSEGSRVQRGTLGHTDAWADQSPTALFSATTTRALTNETVALDATVSTGDIASYTWDLTGDGTVDATGPTANVTFEAVGEYEISLTVTDSSGANETTTWTLPVSKSPAPVVNGSPPQDLDGDGLYEAVRGSDEFTILDVQSLFTHLNSPAVTNSTWAYDFADTGDVSTLDVQALFDRLNES